MERIKSQNSLVDSETITPTGKTTGNHNVAVMNAKLRLMRLVMAATFGSLLWAGCSSNRPHESAERIPTHSQAAALTK